eukprot:1129079-Heterocapsa_arctica.AAC.1
MDWVKRAEWDADPDPDLWENWRLGNCATFWETRRGQQALEADIDLDGDVDMGWGGLLSRRCLPSLALGGVDPCRSDRRDRRPRWGRQLRFLGGARLASRWQLRAPGGAPAAAEAPAPF